jgi:hypothetical protein
MRQQRGEGEFTGEPIRQNSRQLPVAQLVFANVSRKCGNPHAVDGRLLQGPTIPELVSTLPDATIIDRSSVNAWDDARVAAAIEATGRKKLIFAGVSLEVCAAFPAITAIGKGYEAYVPVDACGTFSQAKHEAGLLRMQQAGVILSDYATLAIEILKDNSRPDAGPVYAALAMPFAVLVGQIAHAYGH